MAAVDLVAQTRIELFQGVNLTVDVSHDIEWPVEQWPYKRLGHLQVLSDFIPTQRWNFNESSFPIDQSMPELLDKLCAVFESIVSGLSHRPTQDRIDVQ